MKIIFKEQKTAKPPTFGDVEINQFFVDIDGYLCQKNTKDTYHTIAAPSGLPFAGIVDRCYSSEHIQSILPEVERIEF
jgi:hypothetical protein